MIQHIIAAHEDRYLRANLAFINGEGDRFAHFRDSTASCCAVADLDPDGIGAIYPTIESD
jgi:hypothetical protein